MNRPPCEAVLPHPPPLLLSLRILEGKASHQPLAMTCAFLLIIASPLLKSSLHQSVWDRSCCGNKQPPNLRGTKQKGFISQSCSCPLLGVWGLCPASISLTPGHRLTEELLAGMLPAAWQRERAWPVVCWLLKLLPGSDTHHFRSHFIGQNKSHS